MARPLGREQQGVLRALVERHAWHGYGWGCGWVWSTMSGTERILETLVKRGLVQAQLETIVKGHEAPVYRPTEAGRKLVAAWKQARLEGKGAA